MGANHLAKVVGITAVATEWFHQHGDTRLMLHNQRSHDLVEVRAMIPAIAAGDVHDLFHGLFVAIVAPIDMKARALEMGKTGRKAQGLGSRRGQQAVECRSPHRHKECLRPAQGRHR